MSRKAFVYTLIAGTLALLAFAGLSLYRSVSAAAPAFVFQTTPAAPPTGKGGGMGGWGMGARGGISEQDLATALGITVDDLNTAYQKANDATLADALQKGLLTQTQVDQLKTNGGAFPFGGRWAGWLQKQGVDYDTQLADALGITTDQLQAAYLEAFDASIDQQVIAGRYTQEQGDLLKGQHALYADPGFNTALQDAYQAAVKQAVTNGVITQAQADLILQAADKKGFGFGMPYMEFPGFGRGGMMRGGPGGGQPPASGGGNAPAPSGGGLSPAPGGGNTPAPSGGGQTAPYPPATAPAATPTANY
jgi:hypothetical protein